LLRPKYIPVPPKRRDILMGEVKIAFVAFVLAFCLAAGVEDFRCFPLNGRTAIHEDMTHLFNDPAYPPGIIAEYKGYQLFLVHARDTAKAASLLFEHKKTLQESHYLPNMGGYFGTDAKKRPQYTFAKGSYFAGIIGLKEEAADPIAREFAGRIPYK